MISMLFGNFLNYKPKPNRGILGIFKPAPDNKPDLKADEIRADLFCAGTLDNCIKILMKELPYWHGNQSKYPDECALVEKSVYYTLTAQWANCETLLPPVPRGITELLYWVVFVESYLPEQTKEKNWSELRPDTKAIAILYQNPDMSMAKIAKKVGVSRPALYLMDRVIKARKVFKADEAAAYYDAKPHGTKDEHGNLEAWEK